MTNLYLVRHGETDWNRARRIQGSTDIPLNDTGRAQAATTGALLARREWDAIISSPLSRAYETASIIARETGLAAPTTRDTLVERGYGAAEGLDHREVDTRFPDGEEVPGRESRDEVMERVVPALLSIAAEHPGENVIVVSHGGVIRAVLSAIEPDNAHGTITNGSIHSVRIADGSLELIAFDDPIDELSLACGTDDIEQQNALESRDAVSSAGA
ncbi:putative phosphoglycerate mutase [Glaciihabitans tibetensis]|uniref:Putative phosphoglycerate mutase n=1 Tax=Glaciihabitans tibetensis TaxID=1266600 RepID=A0A2T0VJS7_9MICO|nr:histidine phosphatase family protein [Glaciihabitans tibetensis]PRY70468.1 putative phosphoglycerate mutase [Glaciihabitans tibetensis]